MRFSLIPREVKFFTMFDEFAADLTQAAEKFYELVTVFDRLEGRCHELKDCEKACDAHVQKIIQALVRTFVTPFDREDIHALATSLDDVINKMEKTAHRLDVFRIEKPTRDAVELARIVKECCVRLESAIGLLENMRNSEKIHALLREIADLENDADRVYRHADAALFGNLIESSDNGRSLTPGDLLALVKWREIYEWLEEAVDACKHTANVISEIVIKGT